MRVHLLHDHFDPSHLEAVKADMLVLGAPTIRAVDMGGWFAAVEGCHRLRAAHALGLTPVLVEVPYSEEDGVESDDGDFYTFAQIADDAHRQAFLDF